MLRTIQIQNNQIGETFLEKTNAEAHNIQGLIKGDELAQKAVYDTFAPKMLAACNNFISDRTLAEEAMNNGFVKVFFNIKKYKNEGSFEGWIRKIMIRESLSFLRKKKFVIASQSEIILEKQKTFQKPVAEVSEIQRLVEQLPIEFKLVFNLYAVEGYAHKEIAELLKIPEATSKTRLFRARKLLKEQLQNHKKANGRL
ncbi:putative RNA polymerase ECF-type sigma factor [Kordia algicida OT-1]|uniref:Putative RNA polymerase ECF-type sigma factor n=1 Tax=Kordia algicida OT-1 TaxID=391587 RepID=A9DPN0_9FLAO|nr:putative RNA polymerase ECF-type sigma factor [Kordia algicida OT-1]